MAVKKRTTLTIVLLVGFAALMVGMFISQKMVLKQPLDVSQFNGTVLEHPRQVSEFSLKGTDDTDFNNEALKGRWTMVFFGFTNCGYLCPTTMTQLAKMYTTLESQHTQPLPQVVLVSIDPERDTLEKLKHYAASFNSHFYGARGDEAAIKKMTKELGIAFSKVALPNANGTDSKQNYDVQHSGTVMLFNPQGELATFFTSPHQPELLAKDYQLLVRG